MIETIRYAFRSLRRNPGFAVLIFSIITISIAACCCIFSILYVQVLKPTAFEYPEQLVWILPDPFATIHDYKEWVRPSQTLESVAAFKTGGFQVRIGDERMRFTGYYVTSSFFSVLKARPILGPGFSAANDLPGKAPVVIISYNLWKGAFHGDQEIIGRQIGLNTMLHTIVGVMPKHFDWGQFLFPMSDAKGGPGRGVVMLFGALKQGSSETAASAEMHASDFGNYRWDPVWVWNSTRFEVLSFWSETTRSCNACRCNQRNSSCGLLLGVFPGPSRDPHRSPGHPPQLLAPAWRLGALAVKL